MNQEQLKRMTEDKGFIAALDQSGGSTPKALKAYGVDESAYRGEEEMFTRVHEMRTRIIKSPSFDKSEILAAILFENTMDRRIDSLFTGGSTTALTQTIAGLDDFELTAFVAVVDPAEGGADD